MSAGLPELQTFSQSYGWSPACEQEYGKCPSLCGTLFVTQTGPAVTAGDHTAGRHAHSVRRERGAADTFSDCSRCSWLEHLRLYAHYIITIIIIYFLLHVYRDQDSRPIKMAI